ncbi:MAG: hypothetical protein SFU56_04045 [Capsulimonadales bacterium]|nr:hypothetical protein [Capsulimonadales bacterium]
MFRRRWGVSTAVWALLVALGGVLLPGSVAGAQATQSTGRPVRGTTVKPDRRLTLLLTVASVPGPGQAIVRPIASASLPKPEGLPEAFPLRITPKTVFHLPDGRSTPFLPDETLVVRVDLFAAPTFRGEAREMWDVPSYDAYQRLRKEVAVGTVSRAPVADQRRGVLVVTREDETLAEYRVTEKSRFCRGDVEVLPSVYAVGTRVAVKPRALPSGGAMAGIVAESPAALDRAYRDTLTVWRGVLERVEIGAFYFVLRRDDGAKRRVRFPKIIRIMTEEDAKKRPLTGRIYQFAEIIEHPILVRLVRGERPDPDGTRTADKIYLIGGKGSPVTPPKPVVPPGASELPKPGTPAAKGEAS